MKARGEHSYTLKYTSFVCLVECRWDRIPKQNLYWHNQAAKWNSKILTEKSKQLRTGIKNVESNFKVLQWKTLLVDGWVGVWVQQLFIVKRHLCKNIYHFSLTSCQYKIENSKYSVVKDAKRYLTVFCTTTQQDKNN